MSLNPFRWHLKDWRGFEGKVHIQLQRNYVSQGKAVFGFVYGLIALFGIASQNWKLTLFMGVSYYIISYFLGRYLYHHQWVEADVEAANRYNPFVKEMRSKIGIPKSI